MALTDQAVDFAAALIAKRLLPVKAAPDALHVAIATVHRMDFLLTWNCHHLANPMVQAKLADYAATVSLSLPFICTPEELSGDRNG